MALSLLLRASGLAIIGFVSLASACIAGTLEDIKARGELIAGVKADYPLFAGRNNSNEIVGLEVDLARDLANRLGVKLKLFAVSADGRIQFLQQGSIDLIIATMAVTEARKQQADLVEPNYYASRVALLAPKSAGIGSLVDLKGKPVCAILNAYYHAELASRAAEAKLVPLRKRTEVAKALRDGRCVAMVDENSRLFGIKAEAGSLLADYKVIPLDFPPLTWAIAVRTGEKNSPFGKLVADAVTDWHKSGRLITLEKQWLGENTSWPAEEQKALN